MSTRTFIFSGTTHTTSMVSLSMMTTIITL